MIRTALAAGVTPELFWKLSLKEWRMLTETVHRATPLGRAGLERLMAAWPDGEES